LTLKAVPLVVEVGDTVKLTATASNIDDGTEVTFNIKGDFFVKGENEKPKTPPKRKLKDGKAELEIVPQKAEVLQATAEATVNNKTVPSNKVTILAIEFILEHKKRLANGGEGKDKGKGNDNFKPVTGQTITELAGVEVSIRQVLKPENVKPTAGKWIVAGGANDRIKDYEQTEKLSPKKETDQAKDIAKGEVVPLTNADLIGAGRKNITFFWVSSGTGRDVTRSITVRGVTFTKKVTFNVVRPTGDFKVAFTIDKVSTDLNYFDLKGRKFSELAGEDESGQFLHLGEGFHFKDGKPEIKPGIQFMRTKFEVPAGFKDQVEVHWLQTGRSIRTQTVKKGTAKPIVEAFTLRTNVDHLDTGLKYVGVDKETNPTIAIDSPGTMISTVKQLQDGNAGTGTRIIEALVNDSFKTFLVFKPEAKGLRTIILPLRKVEWQWRAAVTRNGNTLNWTIVEKVNNKKFTIVPNADDLNKKIKNVVKVADFPKWKRLLQDGTFKQPSQN